MNKTTHMMSELLDQTRLFSKDVLGFLGYLETSPKGFGCEFYSASRMTNAVDLALTA